MKKIIQFVEGRPLPPTGDMADYLFRFVIDNKNSTEIKTSISGPLVAVWFKNVYTGIENVLFQFAKRHLIEKLNRGSLSPKEEVILTASNQSSQCPFKLGEIDTKVGSTFEIDI